MPRAALAGLLALAALTGCRGDGAVGAAGVELPTPTMRAGRPTPTPALEPPGPPEPEPTAEAPPAETPLLPPPEPLAPLPDDTVGGPDFARVFEVVAPSVVGVVAGRLVDGKYKADRTGTGFIWDAAGHVVTNAHLVGDAPRMRIRTRDGRVTRARLIGLDAATDLAVLAPGPLGLPPVARGPVDALRPGSWVAAIGNPHGMDHSITVGVVSGVGRRTLPPGAPRLAEFIQSDVTVDAGSSGGPLVDTRGRVIGLNTAIVGGKLAFSIRIDMVATVAERLIAEGEFARGFAGLYAGPVTTKIAREAGLERRRGARVRGLVADGPAHRAGIAPGDIILRFGAHPVEDPDALPWLIAATRPDTDVPVRLARGTERHTLTLRVGEASE